jgi:hypothetical protein
MKFASRTFALAALGALSLGATAASDAATRSSDLQEIRCDTLEMDRGRVQTVMAPELRVLRDTAQSGAFEPGLEEGVVSIMCSRNQLLPAANDDEVLWLGMPLHIAEMGSPGRLGVLELYEGRYRFRMLEGRLRDGEQAQIDSRLAEFQARFQQVLQQQQRR